MGYKSPKRYILTPRRKKFGKAIARRFNSSVIDECLKQEDTRKNLFKKLINLLQEDIRRMCSSKVNSILQNKTADALKQFSWDTVMKELVQHAPTLLHVLRGCTFSKKNKDLINGTTCVCAAIIMHLKNQKMNMLQRILSLVLYAGHSAKLVCN